MEIDVQSRILWHDKIPHFSSARLIQKHLGPLDALAIIIQHYCVDGLLAYCN
jgi:hypothetical protein